MLLAAPSKAQLSLAVSNFNSKKYDKAKEKIDACLENDELKNDARMWFYRGQIYTSIAQNETKRYGALKEANPEAIYIAYEAFRKSMELEPKKTGYYIPALRAQQRNLHPVAINEGVELYKAGKIEGSLKAFELAQQTNKRSLLPFIYGGDVARELKQDDKYESSLVAIQKIPVGAFEILLKEDELEKLQNSEEKKMRLEREKVRYARALMFLYRKTKQYGKGVEAVDKALVEFPEDTTLRAMQVEFYVATNKLEEAIVKMEEAVQKNPRVAGNYINLGIIYEKAGKPVKAEEAYKKCLLVEPGNFNANYNLGVLAYNEAATLTNEMDKQTLPDYIKNGKKKEKRAVKAFEKALPYFEKLNEQKPNDAKILKPLSNIYKFLSSQAKSGNKTYKEKYEEIQKKL
ncbi:hypothetical protein BKI52_02350 [marine bacterium AO1-C]|nr:hypothetical protein BKI52_02350 [marine bacterium AO1-C]